MQQTQRVHTTDGTVIIVKVTNFDIKYRGIVLNSDLHGTLSCCRKVRNQQQHNHPQPKPPCKGQQSLRCSTNLEYGGLGE